VIRSSRRCGPALACCALLAATGLALVASACGAGQQAQTSRAVPSVDGARAQAGRLALRGVVIAYPDSGSYQSGSDARVELAVVNNSGSPDALVEVRTDDAARVTLATAATSGSASPSATGTSSPAADQTPPMTTRSTATPSGSSTPSGAASPSGSSTPSGTATRSGTATSSEPTPTASATAEAPTRIPLPAGTLVSFRDSGPVITLVGLTRDLLPSQLVPITFVFENAGEVTVEVPVAIPLSPISPPPTTDVAPTSEA
jgi:copper(I)-binding protein